MRKLGIPTVLDRFIQQAVLQVLQSAWDWTFSDNSFGFRPGRSAKDAVVLAQEYIAEGYDWVVDMDLEKFFDRVNHDILMSKVEKRVADKRLLRLIRAFLNAGVMESGLVGPTDEGTPQGGPLSPLLSNLMLDELDKTLEQRGHRFVRYADDCNIYVRSERAGRRILANLTVLLRRRLKLTVNESKSAVARPGDRKFLGISFYMKGSVPKRCIAPQALIRFKKRVRELTPRRIGGALQTIVDNLSQYLQGWRGYFEFAETPWTLASLDKWVRRRLRALIWFRWKTTKNRLKELLKRGVKPEWAKKTAGSSKGVWHLSACQPVQAALNNAYFAHVLRLVQLASRKR